MLFGRFKRALAEKRKEEENFIRDVAKKSGLQVIDKDKLRYKTLSTGEIFELKGPDLNGYTDFKIVKWHVSKGTKVKEGKKLCTMKNNELTLTAAAPATGRLIYTFSTDTIIENDMIIAKIEGL